MKVTRSHTALGNCLIVCLYLVITRDSTEQELLSRYFLATFLVFSGGRLRRGAFEWQNNYQMGPGAQGMCLLIIFVRCSLPLLSFDYWELPFLII